MSSVAVVIPVHNGALHLPDALQSVLDQTRRADEVVVVDDGSTDASAEIADRFDGVRVIRQPKSGPAAARNRGVASTDAAIICFLDADDLMTPIRIERQLALLEARPDVIGCVGRIRVFSDADGERLANPEPGPLAGVLMTRRSAFATVGPFDTSIVAGEYADWYLRARTAGLTIETLDDVLVHRRAHESNLTRDQERLAEGFLRVAHLAIERSRNRLPPASDRP